MTSINYKMMRISFTSALFFGGIHDELKMEQYAENNFISLIHKEWIGDFVLLKPYIFIRDDIKNVYNTTFNENKLGIASDLCDIQFRNSEIQKHIIFKW